VAVVVLTMVEDDDSVFAAMQAGAKGYLLKEARRDEIVRTIRAVAEGDAVFGSGVAGRLIRYFDTPSHSRAAAFPELTTREVQILSLLAQHLNNPIIGGQLGITEKTVRNDVSAILTKLRVAGRASHHRRARSWSWNLTCQPFRCCATLQRVAAAGVFASSTRAARCRGTVADEPVSAERTAA
jgi:DNA-binding NarL/FixJ family response regulator